ncbi:MAG TPA: aldehyde ferredoxin oxidoreductase C-terminal domain-containing protein, partial [Geobacteraceae bacterium]|nr:aldehyde ferredoxin oxidoreductase C-terminal domain-containing protein [Geobacteraceae bacterium]
GAAIGKTAAEIAEMTTAARRERLMTHRKEELHRLVEVYYEERGWNASGIPTVETLKFLGLWNFLNKDARVMIAELNHHVPIPA